MTTKPLNRARMLVDFNNIALMALHNTKVELAPTGFNVSFWHYLMFDRLQNMVVKALLECRPTSGMEVILACDVQQDNWRKEIYPLYKADRHRDPNIPWDQVWEEYHNFLDMLQEFLPFHVLKLPGAEADDIIAVLAKHHDGQVVVCSTDSDYLQLLKHKNVKVYNPVKEEFITFPGVLRIGGTKTQCDSVEEFLQLSIMTGQGGKDNVFNIKTAEDLDWTNKRKPGFGVVAARKALEAKEGTAQYLTKLGLDANYERNRTLIDFDCIPEEVSNKVLALYKKQVKDAPPLPNDFQGFVYQSDWKIYNEVAEDMDEMFKMQLT
jgi:hypothetical protein